MGLVHSVAKTMACPLLECKQNQMNLRAELAALGLNPCWSIPVGEKTLSEREGRTSNQYIQLSSPR